MTFQTSVAGAWKKWAQERTKCARETRPRTRSLLRPNSFKRGLRFQGLFFLDTPATISRKRPLFRAPRRVDCIQAIAGSENFTSNTKAPILALAKSVSYTAVSTRTQDSKIFLSIVCNSVITSPLSVR